MRYLVIGGAGYIGSHFVRQAQDEGHDCLVLDNLSLGYRQSLRSTTDFVEADLIDSDVVKNILSNFNPEVVFHFAAFALVNESVLDPAKYYQNNVEAVKRLLDQMKDCCPSTPLIFSSSCAVFGIPSRLPISEHDPKNPISPYGKTKLIAEFMMADYARAYGMKGIALRYFNACGAHPSGQIGESHQPETHLIPNIIKSVMENREVQIFGSDFPTKDGTCVRDYIHVMDLVSAHLQAAVLACTFPQGQFEAIHLGTGKGYSNLEILQAVEKVLGQSVRYRLTEARAGDPAMLYACTEKASKILNFRPRYSDLQTIVETAWAWHRDHPRGF